MLYTIIRSPIFKPGNLLLDLAFNRHLIILDEKSVTESLKKYKNIFVTDSLEKAQEIADSFYHQDGWPKVSGKFGLIVQLEVKFKEVPEKITFDSCEFHNAWVGLQQANYQEKYSNDLMEGYKISPGELASVKAIIVPEKVSSKYPSIQSQNFEEKQSKCTIM